MIVESPAQSGMTKTALKKLRKQQRQATRDANTLLARAARYEKQKRRLSRCYPSEPRMEAAMVGKPLPGEPCGCERCKLAKQEWPVGYQRAGTGKSYECWLHEQSDWFLWNLPSSSSIVRFG